MMNRDPRLERYLSYLEAALKPFPVSDRAEIITEIKSHEPEFEWECRGSGGKTPEPMIANGTTALDFSSLGGVRCDLRVPKNVKLKIAGGNGRVSLADADYEVDVDLERGRVSFDAAEGVAFKYDVKVDAGRSDSFESSTLPNAHLAKIHVGSGRIGHDD